MSVEIKQKSKIRGHSQKIDSVHFSSGKGTFSALQGHAKVGLNHRDGKACGSALKSLTLLP